MQENNELGKMLIDIRVAKKLSTRAAAKKIGVNYVTLNRFENGIFIPSDDNLMKISHSYELSKEEEFELFYKGRKVHPDVKRYLLANYNELKLLMSKALKIK